MRHIQVVVVVVDSNMRHVQVVVVAVVIFLDGI